MAFIAIKLGLVGSDKSQIIVLLQESVARVVAEEEGTASHRVIDEGIHRPLNAAVISSRRV